MNSISTIPQTGNKKKKSVLLTQDEHKALKKYYKTFHTDTDFSDEMNVGRSTLMRVLIIGSGSELTIKKIREKLNAINETATA
jgi:predicted DNA-binding protein (UPF0251 family)